MRLPRNNEDDAGDINYDELNKMVDTFLERGFTYFDTAWMYCKFKSEEAVKICLVDRHPRVWIVKLFGSTKVKLNSSFLIILLYKVKLFSYA